jgi:branched-chain amino acid transport system substrate-binding protein
VDYAFGWSVEKYLRMVGEAHGIEFIGRDYHALGEREYSGLVTKAAGANPDVVCMINFGLDAVQAVREIYNFKLAPRVPLIMSWSAGVEELAHLIPEMRENLWVGTNFYYTADTPIARSYAKHYTEKYGMPPGYAPGATYGMTRILLRAMERAKSTDVTDVIKAMEGWEFEDLLGKQKIDAATHQTLRPYFFLRCKAKDQMKDKWDFADIVDTGSTPQPRELNQCKDIGEF